MTDPAEAHLADLRARMLAACRAMSRAARHQAAIAACTRLAALDAFRQASVILLYLPLPEEIDTTPAAIRCFQHGKSVCTPIVDWHRREITTVEVTAFDDHTGPTDTHGLRTPPNGRPVVPQSIDLAVIPGLAFDAHGRRAGSGGPCFRRFLTRLRPSATTVGLSFDAQIIDEIPPPLASLQLDLIVTERRVTHPRRLRSRR